MITDQGGPGTSGEMTLHVDYRADEFAEAAAALRAQKLLTIGTLPILYVYVAFSLGSIVGSVLQDRPVGTPPLTFVDVFIRSLTMVIVGIYWGVMAVGMKGKRARGYIKPPPPLTGMGTVAMSCCCLAVFIVSAVATAFTPIGPPDPPAPARAPLPLGTALAMLIFPFVPIGAVVLTSIYIGLRLYRRNVTRTFELLASGLRPATVIVGDDGVVLRSDVVETRYDWSAFVGWQETTRLFLLYRSYVTFEMIPKRAFGSEAEQSEFADLIARRVGDWRRGFEPLPAAPTLVDSGTATSPARARQHSGSK